MNSTLAGRTIVVPLDGSTAAEQAIPLAVGLARATQSRVRLLHVRWLPVWPDEFPNPVPLPTTRRMLDSQGVTYMSDVCERLQATGLEIETVVLPGELLEVGQVILEYLEAHPVDLVVMATHGRGSVKRAWLGGVTDYLVRHLAIPVLAVRPGMALSAAGRQILVPLDGSGFGEAALDEACALAGATQQPLVLLGVVDPVMQPLAGLEATYVGLDPESTELRRSAAEEYLKQLEARVQARGLQCSTVVAVASAPAECIIDLARPDKFAMIVMATHGRGGLRRIILGSVTDKVVRGSDVPVMVVRPAATAARVRGSAVREHQAGPTSCAL